MIGCPHVLSRPLETVLPTTSPRRHSSYVSGDVAVGPWTCVYSGRSKVGCSTPVRSFTVTTRVTLSRCRRPRRDPSTSNDASFPVSFCGTWDEPDLVRSPSQDSDPRRSGSGSGPGPGLGLNTLLEGSLSCAALLEKSKLSGSTYVCTWNKRCSGCQRVGVTVGGGGSARGWERR